MYGDAKKVGSLGYWKVSFKLLGKFVLECVFLCTLSSLKSTLSRSSSAHFQPQNGNSNINAIPSTHSSRNSKLDTINESLSLNGQISPTSCSTPCQEAPLNRSGGETEWDDSVQFDPSRHGTDERRLKICIHQTEIRQRKT